MSQKRLLALVGAAAIFAAACGGPTATPPAAGSVDPGTSAEPGASADASTPPAASGPLAAEQILRVDIAGEPPTLDPNKAQDSNSLTVLRALHRPLVYINAELETVPALAESWEISDDAKELTFTLRDAQYSNGDPIVAGDLVYSWKRLVDPRTAAPYSLRHGRGRRWCRSCWQWPAPSRPRRTPRSMLRSRTSALRHRTTRRSS